MYRNDWMTLREDHIRRPDGSRGVYGVIDKPDYALVIPPGMSSQRGWVFLATGVRHGEPDREHEEQDMISGWFTRSAFEQMVLAGEVTDAQSVAAYARLLLWERNTR